MRAGPLLALCAALAAPAAPAAAPSAAPTWRPPPLLEGRDAPFVTGGHGGADASATGGGPRRLVYYAHLPEVPATATVTAPPRRGRLEASGRRWPPSYTIVDADVAADTLPKADRPRRREFPPPPPGARYDRLPAPPLYYRHGPAPHYHSYSDGPDLAYSGRRPDLDYSVTRPDVGYSAGRPNLDYPAGRPGLDYSVRRPEVDYPPRQPDLDYSARRPDAEYSARRPDFPFPRRPEAGGRTVLDPHHHGAVYRGPQAEDPYREYNPRQPAPWSLQVGARLTVRDDGRRLPLGGAGGGGGGRRFYVSSQPPGPHYAVPLRYA